MIRSVGVIVPAHDEQDLLPACLASVRRAAQALRGVPVHVVVVADACRDRTVRVARRGGASVVSIDARSAGAARAAGAREVLRRTRQLDPASVWLATTDADSVVPSDWLVGQCALANAGWEVVVGEGPQVGRHLDLGQVRVTGEVGHRHIVGPSPGLGKGNRVKLPWPRQPGGDPAAGG